MDDEYLFKNVEKPSNANDAEWTFAPALRMTWDDENGFRAELDLGGSFEGYRQPDGGVWDEKAANWGIHAFEAWMKGLTDSTFTIFEGYKPNDPAYRTAEDIQKEFLQLLNEATGGQRE